MTLPLRRKQPLAFQPAKAVLAGKTVAGKSGYRYGRHGGFCMETMGYPDAIHHAGFPSNVLHPDDTYRQRTIYKFLTRNPGEYND